MKATFCKGGFLLRSQAVFLQDQTPFALPGNARFRVLHQKSDTAPGLSKHYHRHPTAFCKKAVRGSLGALLRFKLCQLLHHIMRIFTGCRGFMYPDKN